MKRNYSVDKKNPEYMEYARHKAAQAWCKEKTKGLVMIPELAEAFAEILAEEGERAVRQAIVGAATAFIGQLNRFIRSVKVDRGK